jgi:hypothetical protein
MPVPGLKTWFGSTQTLVKSHLLKKWIWHIWIWHDIAQISIYWFYCTNWSTLQNDQPLSESAMASPSIYATVRMGQVASLPSLAISDRSAP